MNDKKNKKNRRFCILQKQLLQRRLWMQTGILLYMLLYYPVAIVLLIVRSNEVAAIQNMSEAETLAQRLYEVETWIGIRQSFAFVVVIIAVLLGIGGFSYLFSMEKQDFYESQPVSRMGRFWNIYINGFLMFEIPLIVCTFLAVICAAAMGGMNSLIFGETMVQLLRLTVSFFASYSIGMLAVMLTGNLIVSGIAAVFLLAIDQFIWMMGGWLTSTFYSTYSYLNSVTPSFLFSPIYNAMAPSRYMDMQYEVSYNSPLSLDQLLGLVRGCLKADAANLVIGAVLLVIVIRLYLTRKEEQAGMTVIHKPVRAVVRIVSSVFAALFAGELIINLFSSVSSHTGTAFMLLGIIAAAVLCSGVIEIIYELNIWKFFSHFGEMAAATLAACAIFLIFRYDLTGYDRYIPKAGDVESAALYVYNDSSYYYYETEADIHNYNTQKIVLQRMKLTDMESFRALVEPSMKNARDIWKGSGEDSWEAQICYHMKNGRDIYRSISIPYSMEASVLDAVVGSQEYKEGLIPVYSDTYVQELSATAGTLSYSNGYDLVKAEGSLYTEFEEAYKKDLDQYYSYSQLSGECAVGKVSFQCKQPVYVEQQYDVYPSYVNTITFLKEHDLFLEEGSAEQVEYVDVYEYTDTDTRQVRYTDEESIQKIIDSSDVQISTNWRKTGNLYDYSIDLYVTCRSNEYNVYYSVYFREGEIPSFVQKDLEQSAESD